MPVKCTSKAALRSQIEKKRLGPTLFTILEYIYQNPGCTRNQVSHFTTLKINSVCGRTYDLINRHEFVYESGCVRDAITGESNNRLYVTDAGKLWYEKRAERVAA